MGWRDWSTMSKDRSNVQNAGRSTGSRASQPTTPCRNSWNYMQKLQASYRIQMQMQSCLDALCAQRRLMLIFVTIVIKRSVTLVKMHIVTYSREKSQGSTIK